MTTDQTKSAVILLWIHAWKAYSHFLVKLVLLNWRNKWIWSYWLCKPLSTSSRAWEAFPGRYCRLKASEGAVCTWARRVRGPRPFQSWSAQQQTLPAALGFEPEEGRRERGSSSHPHCQPCRPVLRFPRVCALLPTGPFPARDGAAHRWVSPHHRAWSTPVPLCLGSPRASMLVLLIVTSKSVHQR